MKKSGPELFFFGTFLNTDSSSSLTICSDFLFLHDSVLLGCVFFRNLSISSILSNLGHITAHVVAILLIVLCLVYNIFVPFFSLLLSSLCFIDF